MTCGLTMMHPTIPMMHKWKSSGGGGAEYGATDGDAGDVVCGGMLTDAVYGAIARNLLLGIIY
jgi:hypothetical protein